MTPDQAVELAMQHHRAGNLREAESIYRQVLAHDPKHAGAMHLLGVIARQNGDFDSAARMIEQAIAILSNEASFHANLCDVYCMLNRFDDAIRVGQRAVALDPNLAAAHSNLANAFIATGRNDEAEAEYRAAISTGGTSAAHHSLGCILAARGDVAAAVLQFNAALQLEPEHADAKLHLAAAYNHLGREWQDTGRFAQAAEAHQRSIALNSSVSHVFNDLGNSLNSLHRSREAEAAYRRASELDPTRAEPYSNLGAVLHDRGDDKAAVEAYQTAIRLDPKMAAAYSNLANAYSALGQLDEALTAAEKAVELWPKFGAAHANLANILRDQGLISQAIASYRKAVELRPDLANVHSNLVFAMNFDASVDPQMLLEEHLAWGKKHADPLAPAIRVYANARDPDRRLKIGFVSPDFRLHPIAQFLQPLLAWHDKEKIHITCYSDVANSDHVTAELKTIADEWRDVRGQSHEALAELIRRDEIDILVDLTLHAANNRLLTFARRPAPIQVTYLSYPGTSGMKSIDYRITDAHLDPPDAPKAYAERSLYLPGTYWCYVAAAGSPPVGPPAFESAGHVTFGCLNAFAKASAGTLETWAKILREVPNSRMIIYTGTGAHRDRVREALGQRVHIVPRQPIIDYLKTYHRIDIALDPFPYGGGTSTCDALWMGTPVVTLAGKTAVHRSGVSLLSNVGLPELIANSIDEYIEIAVKLASDRERLKQLRTNLREQMLHSLLMDAQQFAKDFETIFRNIWREWCSKNQ